MQAAGTWIGMRLNGVLWMICLTDDERKVRRDGIYLVCMLFVDTTALICIAFFIVAIHR
jgi:hypothetical protein